MVYGPEVSKNGPEVTAPAPSYHRERTDLPKSFASMPQIGVQPTKKYQLPQQKQRKSSESKKEENEVKFLREQAKRRRKCDLLKKTEYGC